MRSASRQRSGVVNRMGTDQRLERLKRPRLTRPEVAAGHTSLHRVANVHVRREPISTQTGCSWHSTPYAGRSSYEPLYSNAKSAQLAFHLHTCGRHCCDLQRAGMGSGGAGTQERLAIAGSPLLRHAPHGGGSPSTSISNEPTTGGSGRHAAGWAAASTEG